MRRRAMCSGLALIFVLGASVAFAETLSSSSYQLMVGHPSSAGSPGLGFIPASPFGAIGYSLGQLSVTGYSGESVDLSTAANGFWPVVVGGFPNIDVDGDGISSFFDFDDDGDGLADVVESGRGVFASLDDTGSSPVSADTDGDGFEDYQEVNEGGDPNDPGIFPMLMVPALSGLGLVVLTGLLARTAGAARRARMEIL